jgi:hypothetical protein
VAQETAFWKKGVAANVASRKRIQRYKVKAGCFEERCGSRCGFPEEDAKVWCKNWLLDKRGTEGPLACECGKCKTIGSMLNANLDTGSIKILFAIFAGTKLLLSRIWRTRHHNTSSYSWP